MTPNSSEKAVTARGAIVSLETVNFVSDHVEKQYHSYPGTPPMGGELQTIMSLRAWVRNLTYQKNVWVDVNLFDPGGAMIHTDSGPQATWPLAWLGPAGGGGDLFSFDDCIYHGTGAVPGNAWTAPDARTAQYRLYCQMDGQVFTDGILHQAALPSDDAVWNPH